MGKKIMNKEELEKVISIIREIPCNHEDHKNGITCSLLGEAIEKVEALLEDEPKPE